VTVRIWTSRIGAGSAAAGLVAIVVGTFLAWSRSGNVYRDSYQSLGVLRELGFVDAIPALSVFLDVWMAMIPAAAITIALYSLGLRRSAATLATLLSIIMGTIAGAVASQQRGEDELIGIAGTGPVVTLTGAVLALLGAVAILASNGTRVTKKAGGEP
jgi:hypothetical protein